MYSKLNCRLQSYLHIAQTLGSVQHQQLLDEILRDGVHVPRPFNLATENFFINPERIVIVEWRIADDHLVDEYTCGQ